MANNNDSKIVGILCRVPSILLFATFNKIATSIQDDATYWSVLGTVWKKCGSVRQQDEWLPLFRSKRRSKRKLMKSAERKAFDSLPAVVVAYRAINDDSDIDNAISWTLNRTIAERVFSWGGLRQVVSCEFKREDIFAYFDRRGEKEILVWPREVEHSGAVADFIELMPYTPLSPHQRSLIAGNWANNQIRGLMKNNCSQKPDDFSKPSWDEHDFPAICISGSGNWYGLLEAKKPFYTDEWKGKEVYLPAGTCQFLKYGEANGSDIEDMFEIRPNLTALTLNEKVPNAN